MTSLASHNMLIVDLYIQEDVFAADLWAGAVLLAVAPGGRGSLAPRRKHAPRVANKNN